MSPVESSTSSTTRLDDSELQVAIGKFAEEFSSCHTPFRELELDVSLRVVEIIETVNNTIDPVKSFSQLISSIKALDPSEYEKNPLYCFINRAITHQPTQNRTNKEVATVAKVKMILEQPPKERNKERLFSLLQALYEEQGPRNTFVLREFRKSAVEKAYTLLQNPESRTQAIAQIEVAFALFADSLRHDRENQTSIKKSLKNFISKDPTILHVKRLRPFIGELYQALADKKIRSYLRRHLQPKYSLSDSFKLNWPYAKA